MILISEKANNRWLPYTHMNKFLVTVWLWYLFHSYNLSLWSLPWLFWIVALVFQSLAGTLLVEPWLTSWPISGVGGIQPHECRCCQSWNRSRISCDISNWDSVLAYSKHRWDYEHEPPLDPCQCWDQVVFGQLDGILVVKCPVTPCNIWPGAVLHHPGAVFAMGVLRCMIRVCYVGRIPMLRSCWETCCRLWGLWNPPLHSWIEVLSWISLLMGGNVQDFGMLGWDTSIKYRSFNSSPPHAWYQGVSDSNGANAIYSIHRRNAKNSGMICFQDHLLGIAVGHTYFFFEEGWRWSEWVLVPCTRIDWIVKERVFCHAERSCFLFHPRHLCWIRCILWKFEFCCAVPLHSAQDVYPLLPTSKGFRLFRTPRLLKMVGKPKKC